MATVRITAILHWLGGITVSAAVRRKNHERVRFLRNDLLSKLSSIVQKTQGSDRVRVVSLRDSVALINQDDVMMVPLAWRELLREQGLYICE